MDKAPTIQYFFRKPVFPVIVDIDGHLVSAKSAVTLAKRLSKIKILKDKMYNAVDCTGEAWIFYPKQWMLSPITFKKRWTKLEIVRLYNQRENKASEDSTYSEKSLSAKRLDAIVREIDALLNKT